MSEKKEVITFEVDEQTLQDVNKVLERIGATMDDAICLFFDEVIRVNGMPFDLDEYSTKEDKSREST